MSKTQSFYRSHAKYNHSRILKLIESGIENLDALKKNCVHEFD